MPFADYGNILGYSPRIGCGINLTITHTKAAIHNASTINLARKLPSLPACSSWFSCDILLSPPSAIIIFFNQVEEKGTLSYIPFPENNYLFLGV